MAKKASKTSGKFQQNRLQMLIMVAIFAVIGVGAVVITQAKQGNVGGGNASIGGFSSCAGSVWTITARAQASANIMPVDILDDSTVSGTGYRVIASNITLPTLSPTGGNFYNFVVTPQPGAKKVTMLVILHGALSANNTLTNEAILASNRLVNPCI